MCFLVRFSSAPMGGSLRQFFVSAAPRFGGVLLQLVITIFCGRIGGPLVVGALGAYQAWVRATSVGMLAGGNILAVRTFSPVRDVLSQESLRFWARKMAIRALTIGGVLFCVASVFCLYGVGGTFTFAFAVIAGAVFFSLGKIGPTIAQVHGRPVSLMLVDSLLPAVFLALLFFFGVYIGTVSASYVVGACLVAMFLASIIGGRQFRQEVRNAPTGDVQSVVGSALRFGAGVSVASAQLGAMAIPVLAYGMFARIGVDALAVFAVAMRLASLAGVLLAIVDATLSPKLARAVASRSHRQIVKTVVGGATFACVLFSPVLVTCFFFAEDVLAIFGLQGGVGAQVLLTVVSAYFVNAATGSSTTLLVMIGRARTAMLISIASTATFAVLALSVVGGSAVVGGLVFGLVIAIRGILELSLGLRRVLVGKY